ncbi:MAG TPA: peptide ABC transporter substrate-binding protein [Crenotrichaceae bacterium]|nr:peptide ABC transporter substrate-binding protein [Crenotrichaceae bacterium]
MAISACDESRSVTETNLSVLRRGNGAEPQTLDPHRAEGVPAANILRDLYEGLVSETPDGQLIPGVAESWEISANASRYIFHLRNTARWSNGDEITADDFVYSFRRSINPATGSSYSQVLSCIVNVKQIIAGHMGIEKLGVKALDKHTLEITLNAPTPYFLSLLTHSTTYPVHRKTVEAWHGHFSRPDRLVSNGAYTLANWVVQSQITLDKNPHYWDASNTRVDRVVYYAIDDASQELQRYWAGELDWTESIPVGQVDWVRSKFGDQLRIAPYLGTYYYGLNVTRAPFKDQPELRHALWLAIDRDTIVSKITAAGELPAYSWVPPGVLHYQVQSTPDQNWSVQQRLSEARRLYRQAGYSAEHPLKLQLLYNTSDNHKRIALAVSSMWKKALGVETELINEEWKVFLDHRKQLAQTQVVRGGWIADYNDAWSFAELLQSDNPMNNSGYSSPEYDALLSRASTETDAEKRQQLLQHAERVMLSDMPIIPIFFYVSKSLIKPAIKGFESNIMDHHYSKHLSLDQQSFQ